MIQTSRIRRQLWLRLYQEALRYGTGGEFPDIPPGVVAILFSWLLVTAMALTLWVRTVR